MTFDRLYTLEFVSGDDFDANLEKLVALLSQTTPNSLSLAPEVCVTNFSYDRFEEASRYAPLITQTVAKLSHDRAIALTMIEKEGARYLNRAKLFYKGRVHYARDKHKLFLLGDEHEYFSQGKHEDIAVFELNGIKVALLICFELRFVDIWKKVQGADVILIPAMWGRSRAEHLKALSKALAIMNQCYVVVSDSANADMAKSSAIISPFGGVVLDETKELLSQTLDTKEIKKMRRYLDVGIV